MIRHIFLVFSLTTLISLVYNRHNFGEPIEFHKTTKARSKTASSPKPEINDLKEFLKKVVADYNLAVSQYDYRNRMEDAWEDYVTALGKVYTSEEKEMRKALFRKNFDYIGKHNVLFDQVKVSYGTSLNHLSDRTIEELKKLRSFRPHNGDLHRHPKRGPLRINDTRYYHHSPGSKVPVSVDWRELGYVTPVKFQGMCASCYAFAGIGALEAYRKKRKGSLISLSVQNVLDCTWDLGNTGCDGGSIVSVFEDAESMGIESEQYYPYTMNASFNCLWKKERVDVFFDDFIYTVIKGNEVALQHAVANYGPVAVGIGIAEGFDNYESGFFNPPRCGRAVQAVLIVGYGESPVFGDYWLIKNSYGEWWGENGYMRMARNKNNLCNVASHAVFPI